MKSSIVEARVFIDRAILTRRINVPAGQRQAVFEPLPLSIEVQALHARAISSDGRDLSVIGVLAQPVERTPSAEAQELERAREALDVELALLHDHKQTADRAAAWLSSYVAIATQSLAHEWLEQSPAFDRWQTALDHLREAFRQRGEAEARRKRENEQILETRAKLAERAEAIGRETQIGWRVEVELEPTNAEVVVELYTTTYEAQWMPSYDARLDGTKALTLTAFAAVKNATGESWDEVRLVATTARPKLSEPAPELQRMVVVAKGRGQRGLALGAGAAPVLARGAAPGPSEEADAVEHLAPGKVSVPAGMEAVRVRLFEAELEARLSLVLAPLVRRAGSWVADLANTSGKILLPGRAQIFRDGAYAGVAELPFVVPGQRMQLPLGSDATIRVQRAVHRRPREHRVTAGAVLDMMANGARGTDAEGRALGVGVEQFDWRLQLENASPSKVSATILDRVPVSRTSVAQVKLGPRPEGLRVEEESGFVTIELELAPFEKKRLETSYTITTPIGFELPTPGRL